MYGVQLLEKPAAFLALFSLSALGLLPIWIYLSPHYLAGITAVVNLGLHSAGIASQFRLQDFTGGEVFLPGIVGGAALFVATPSRSIHWKVGWVTLLLVLSGIVLATTLFLQAHSAYTHLLVQFESTQQFSLEQDLLIPGWLSDRLDAVLSLFKPGLYFILDIVLWLMATRR